jgi:hypothetical protein
MPLSNDTVQRIIQELFIFIRNYIDTEHKTGVSHVIARSMLRTLLLVNHEQRTAGMPPNVSPSNTQSLAYEYFYCTLAAHETRKIQLANVNFAVEWMNCNHRIDIPNLASHWLPVPTTYKMYLLLLTLGSKTAFRNWHAAPAAARNEETARETSLQCDALCNTQREEQSQRRSCS